jgi:hypothetical protein
MLAMTFADYMLEKRLEKYDIPQLTTQEISDLRNKTSLLLSKIGSTYLSKERIFDAQNQHHHEHVHVKEVDHVNTRHFFNEFPRKQSNNDMSYHEEDITIRFIYDYFFNKSEKK